MRFIDYDRLDLSGLASCVPSLFECRNYRSIYALLSHVNTFDDIRNIVLSSSYIYYLKLFLITARHYRNGEFVIKFSRNLFAGSCVEWMVSWFRVCNEAAFSLCLCRTSYCLRLYQSLL